MTNVETGNPPQPSEVRPIETEYLTLATVNGQDILIRSDAMEGTLDIDKLEFTGRRWKHDSKRTDQ